MPYLFKVGCAIIEHHLLDNDRIRMTGAGNPEQFRDETTRHIEEILHTLGAASMIGQPGSGEEVQGPAAAEQAPQSPFASFLLDHPELADANPEETDIFWDLDETMFSRTRGEYGKASKTHLTGSWRPDMPQLLAEMQRRGFRSMHILSSADLPYINAALDIFRQQFSKDPTEYFDRLGTTGHYGGTKLGACYDEASHSSTQGRRAVFIDDSPIPFEQRDAELLGYVRIDRDMRYGGDPDLQFTTPFSAR
jgi:hypothetical protein